MQELANSNYQQSELLQKFDSAFRQWVKEACQEWGYGEPSQQYFSYIDQRLPEGLRALLGYGIKNKVIIPKGRVFTLKDLPQSKGTYNWFSHGRAPKPAPNWEYFVQVAEFIRFHAVASMRRDLSITFEDGLMDIGVYRNNKLFIYCEIKERASQIQKLVQEIRKLQSNIDLTTPDRGNDPLRKAKYLIKQKPEYFVTSAIGARFEYRVVYPSDRSFELVRDIVPLI